MSVNQGRKLNLEYENYAERINLVCSDFRIDSLKPQIAAISETCRENVLINVALVGGFNTGYYFRKEMYHGKD
ncbi:MAG: hypothetical protein V1653_02135 [bacterium]